MFNFKEFLRKNAILFHYLVSKSITLSNLYVYFLSIILKPLPFHKIKQQVLNSLNSIEWKITDVYPPQIIAITEDIEFKIIPHFQEFDSESLFFRKLSYEAEVFKWLKQHTSEYEMIIEIGANVGIFSLFFWKAFLHYNKNPNNIFIFEPSRKAYLRLLKNLDINQANSIQTYNCAVSDITGFVDFFEPQGHLTNGSLNKEFAGLFSNQVLCNKTLTVNADYLNNLVNSSQDHILIKIDVEGSEFEVLSGLKNFILACKPTLIIEVLSMYQLKLNSLGFLHETYNLYNLTKDGLVQYFEFKSTACRDYVLLPK